MPSKTVKTSLDGDIRRLKVELECKDAFRDLSDLVRSVYKLNPEVDLNMKYLDDEEEEITLSSHGELLEAFRIAQEDGRKVLKLFVHSFDNSDALSSTSSFVDVESVSSEPVSEKQPIEEMTLLQAVPSDDVDMVAQEDTEPKQEELLEDVEPARVINVNDESMLLVETDSAEAEVEACVETKIVHTPVAASISVESSDIIELPVVAERVECIDAVSDDEMPALEPLPVPVVEKKDEPVAAEEVTKEEKTKIDWPARADVVGQCVAFITDEQVRAALKDACGLVTRKVNQQADVMEVALDVLAAFPVIRNHSLVQMLLPYLDELVAMAKKIVDWNQEAIVNYVHLAEQLLGNNKFAFTELNLDGILDLLAQAVRTGAKLELDIFWTPNETAAPEDVKEEKTTESKEKNKKKAKQMVHKHVECDVCGAHPIVGIRYKCTKCRNYDLCEACEAKEAHPADHIMMKIRVPVAYAGRARHHQRRFKAEFVRDKTLPDKSVVQGDVVMTKTWIVKNTGDHQWPYGAHLKYISGTVVPVNGKDAKVQIPRAAPGEEVEVTLNIVTPVDAGKSHGNFRLMDNRGKSFGDRLWLNLSVCAPEPESKQAEQVTEPEVKQVEKQEKKDEVKPAEKPSSLPRFQYAEELTQLHGMGFKDDEINKYLLLNNKGNVMRVVEWLLQNQA